ncbi:MAG TPA: ATP-binding protein, partial [Anaerolineales bacterium]|nr:ATP-binding protein [Anaerolineales bacterium]
AGLMAVYQEDQAVDFRLDIAPGLPDVWAERVDVLRVLDNILTNAVRHNGDRATLRVWLRVRREAGEVLFEIGDDGRGFDPAARERLFEFGVTTDSTGRAKAHGMGLWSSKRIITAHGGRIWAEGEQEQGARFYFTLPAAGQSGAA